VAWRIPSKNSSVQTILFLDQGFKLFLVAYHSFLLLMRSVISACCSCILFVVLFWKSIFLSLGETESALVRVVFEQGAFSERRRLPNLDQGPLTPLVPESLANALLRSAFLRPSSGAMFASIRRLPFLHRFD